MREPKQVSVEQVIERMRKDGSRITKKRIRIIEALMDLGVPASAEAIRQKAALPSTDLVTVYRNLDALDAAGLLQRIPLENGSQLFELVAPGDHYHHMICRCCHQTERLDVCLSKEVMQTARKMGYSEIAHTIEVYGLCEVCKA